MADFIGTEGADIFTGGAGNDTGDGKGGDDKLTGGGGFDDLAGGAGADTIDGGDDDDTLYSGDRSPPYTLPYPNVPFVFPELDHGREVDTLKGGAGSDRIFAGYGDNVDGGTDGAFGDDLLISFQGALSGIVADFRLATLTIGGGTITGIEHLSFIEGSNFDDIIYDKSGSAYSSFSAILGMGGNDALYAGFYTGSMFGGDGDDLVDGRGSQYLNRVEGGAGNDTLYTDTNSFAVAYGGDGNDTIYSHGVTSGGAGNDLIILQQSYYSGPVNGDEGDDEIRASANGNRMAGGAGADRILGDGGADVINSAGIDDQGNMLDDRGLEHDVLSGGGGNDLIYAGLGDDVDGGAGSDTLRLSLLGATSGVGVDTLGLAMGQPWHVGGATIQGIETLSYVRGSDFGDDFSLVTQATSLTIDAGGGGDTVRWGGSSVTVMAGDGDDWLWDGAAADIIFGGAGFDTLSYRFSSSAGVTVQLSAGEGQAGTSSDGDQIYDIESVEGTSFADVLIGNDAANTLMGGAGADTLRGGGGDDKIYSDQRGSGDLAGDTVDAGAGDDTVSLNVNDSADGGAGNDVLNLFLDGVDQGVTIDLTALWQGGSARIGSGTVTGFERFEAIQGTGGNDDITIGTAMPVPQVWGVYGGEGDDRLTGGANRDGLSGDAGNDILIGLGNDDILYGGDGDDRLEGGAGNDRLTGSAGHDILIGGDGSDYYEFNLNDFLSNQIIEAAADSGEDKIGIVGSGPFDDSIFAGVRNVEALSLRVSGSPTGGVDFVLGANASLAGFKTISVNGTVDASAMTSGVILNQAYSSAFGMTAGSGDDTLSVDRLYRYPTYKTWSFDGGAGFDTLTINSNGFAEAMSPGSDSGRVLVSNIEKFLLLPGAEPVSQFGFDTAGEVEWYRLTLDDAYFGAGLRAEIDASALRANVIVDLGADHKFGGTGQNADIRASDRLDLDASHLTGGRAVAVSAGASNDTLTGSAAADILDGGGGDDRLDGGGGADRLIGGSGNDSYYIDAGDVVVELAGEGTDTVYVRGSYTIAAGVSIDAVRTYGSSTSYVADLTGNEIANTLVGNAAANRIDGRAGADVMYGYAGDDTYYVDNAGDMVMDFAGGGNDTIVATASYALAAGSEIELLRTIGSASAYAVNLAGNELANVIVGNAASNIINGGGAADVMWGYGGDDFYYVDNSRDVVTERAGEGYDTIYATADFTIAAGSSIELLRTLGSASAYAVNLTGNELANTIVGNAAANIINGGGGADAMYGYGGNDSYYVDNAGDVVIEAAGGGTDIVYAATSYALASGSAVEELRTFGSSTSYAANLTGNELANTIVGNAAGNTIHGGAGNDTLWGYGGNDQLFGDAGNDSFVFGVGFGRDVIADFVGNGAAAGDTIRFLPGTIANFDALMSKAVQQGNDVIFTLDANTSLTLAGSRLSALVAQDFVFG